jgi:hypothetical protein
LFLWSVGRSSEPPWSLGLAGRFGPDLTSSRKQMQCRS